MCALYVEIFSLQMSAVELIDFDYPFSADMWLLSWIVSLKIDQQGIGCCPKNIAPSLDQRIICCGAF